MLTMIEILIKQPKSTKFKALYQIVIVNNF